MTTNDEDNFDIDIYGDGEEPTSENLTDGDGTLKISDGTLSTDQEEKSSIKETALTSKHTVDTVSKAQSGHDSKMTNAADSTAQDGSTKNQPIASSDGPSSDKRSEIPRQAPQKQGVKRKEGAGDDERLVDAGATTALVIAELHWWTTEDDLRGWVNQSECEDELKSITFHEHKVNGKSKGQVYMEFKTPQAASAVKKKIDHFGEAQQYGKKYSVVYSSGSNPFRTLPKDAPPRNSNGGFRGDRSSAGQYSHSHSGGGGPNAGGMAFGMNHQNNNMGGGGGYRGGRGGYNNNRGGGVGYMSGYNSNRGGGGGYLTPSMGAVGPQNGFGAAQMTGGYGGGPMGGMPQFGGFNRGGTGGMMGGMRGGPVGSRGGRGGMGGPNLGMMGGMPGMSGMPGMPGMPGMMGGMMGAGGMAGGMGMMGGGMAAMGMQGSPNPSFSMGSGNIAGPQAHYNPAFFASAAVAGPIMGAMGGDVGGGNPHGAKRQRSEIESRLYNSESLGQRKQIPVTTRRRTGQTD